MGVRRGAAIGDTRRHDLDWVRALAIISVVLYHVAQVFTGQSAAVNAPDASGALREFCYFFHQWRMPLVFCVAGTATWMMLQRRTAQQYARDRSRRLLVPFLFALVALLPPQLYAAQRHERSFIAFYPHFLDEVFAARVPQLGQFWFLAYLLLADLLVIPLVLLALRPGGAARRLAARAAAVVSRPYAILALAVPVAAVRCIPTRWVGEWTVLGLADFKEFALYATLYAFGYLLASSERNWNAAARYRRVALGLAVVTQAAVYLLRAAADGAGGGAHPALSRADDFAGALGMWFWVVATLAHARHHLRRENAVLRYMREASYPVYLLHSTILVLVAAPFARSTLPIWMRFAALSAVTFALTFAAYDLVLKRTDAARFVFGLRPMRPMRARRSAAASGVAALPAAAPLWAERRAS